MNKWIFVVIIGLLLFGFAERATALEKAAPVQKEGNSGKQGNSFSFSFDESLSPPLEKAAVQELSLVDRLALRGFWDATAGADLKNDEPNEHLYDFRNVLKLEGILNSVRQGVVPTSVPTDKRWQALVSLQGDYLWMGPDHSYDDLRLRLHESSFLWATGRYEIKAGKQIIRWGKTDQVSPVDNLNPQDGRQFILRELEDRKIPIWMLRGRAFVDKLTFEGVYIPWFEPSLFDYFDSDWAVYRQVREDVKDGPLPSVLQSYLLGRRVEQREPAKTLHNSEFGGRVTATLSGWDFGLSYLYGWEDAPFFSSFPIKNLQLDGGYSSENLLDALEGAVLVDEPIRVEYRRQQIVGAEFETTAGPVGLRGEAAYFDRVSFLTDELTSVRRPVLHYVLGVDYSSPSEWYANLQWSHQIIAGSDARILYFDQHDTALLAELNQTFWRGQLKAGIKANFNIGNGSFYLQPEVELKYFKNIEVTLGANVFEGDDDSLFGLYNHNDQVFTRFKYFF
ncbi:MAG: hypothetical protein A2X84_09115 [Desulfuromonadaceae bacterium GWC2_58_13]|nr:MAG: hypothetical protein A2X84_09115 [Desulfuromonadaceae bacterium GWC2_58_13]